MLKSLSWLFSVCAVGAMLLITSTVVSAEAIVHYDFSRCESCVDSSWNLNHFRGTTSVQVRCIEEPCNAAVALEAMGSGSTLDSFNVRFPREDKVVVSFRYKTNAESMPLMVAVSGSAGCGAPAIKQRLALVRNDRWQDVELSYDLAGYTLASPVLEFMVEGSVVEGEKIYLDDITVSEPRPEPVRAALFSPGSHQLFEGAMSQDIMIDLEVEGRGVDLTVELIKKAGGQTVYEQDYHVSSTERVTIDCSSYAVGEYVLKVRGGELNTVGQWEIRKNAAQAHSLIIQNHVPYLDGEPYLAIGLYHISDAVIGIINNENNNGIAPGVVITRDTVMQSLADRGFNTVISGWGVASAAFYQVAAGYGLNVISESGTNVANIDPVMTQDNVFGWYGEDEPVASQAEELEELYYAYKEADPYRPVMTAFDNSGVGYGDHRVVDIALPDLYPVGSATSNVGGTALYVDNCHKVLNHEDPTTCVIVVPQLFTADGGRWNGFEPLYDQVRAECYSAVTAGAKGFIYYSYYTHETLADGMALNSSRTHWYLPESNLWSQIGTLNAELMSVKDIILFGEDSDAMSVEGDGVLSRVMTYNGDYYVLIVNPSAQDNMPVSIGWESGWTAPVTVLGNDLVESAGGYQASFGAYEVGMYKITVN